jgi:hypothetical protein
VKLPLLIGVKPKLVREGPAVPLGNGRWRVTSNHRDTSLALVVNGAPVPLGIVHGPCTIIVVITLPGTEDSISAFAERM